MADHHPGLRRILEDAELARGLEQLAALPAQDLTTALLHLFERRAAATTPADVAARASGRFTAPSPIPAERLARLRVDVFAALVGFEAVELAPVVPIGTHVALGDVDQSNVVSAVRGLEVAADPTVGLAIEAARRRRDLLRTDPRSDERVRLVASQRITRAQRFDGPRSFAHFELVAAAIAGRAGPGRTAEADAAVELLSRLCTWTSRTAGAPVRLRLTDLEGRDDVVDRVASALDAPSVTVEPWPERTTGRAYYTSTCFKIEVETDDELVELGDGGFVDWTARLLQNRKERLFTGAVSLERLAMIASSR